MAKISAAAQRSQAMTRKKTKTPKPLLAWMVERYYQLPDGIVAPIRGVAPARTKKEAEQGAETACERAFQTLTQGKMESKPSGPAIVLYPIGELVERGE